MPVDMESQSSLRQRQPYSDSPNRNGAGDGDSAASQVPPPAPDPVPRAPAFAGRVGANLAFTDRNEVDQNPDAAQMQTLGQVLDVHGFRRPIYLRAAAIECWGTFLQVFLAGYIDTAFGTFTTSTSLAINITHSLTTALIISLFIYSTGIPTGGHMNPFITMATFMTGLCTLPRALYYIVGQLIGALAGGFFLKLGLGGSKYFFPDGIVGGCTMDFSQISPGEAFVLEFGVYSIVVFVAFGVGLEPRQGKTLGPALSPILVGVTVGLATFGTGSVHPGWSGASVNPARCFGLMAASERLSTSWIHWLAALTASAIHGVIHYFFPPDMNERWG